MISCVICAGYLSIEFLFRQGCALLLDEKTSPAARRIFSEAEEGDNCLDISCHLMVSFRFSNSLGQYWERSLMDDVS